VIDSPSILRVCVGNDCSDNLLKSVKINRNHNYSGAMHIVSVLPIALLVVFQTKFGHGAPATATAPASVQLEPRDIPCNPISMYDIDVSNIFQVFAVVANISYIKLVFYVNQNIRTTRSDMPFLHRLAERYSPALRPFRGLLPHHHLGISEFGDLNLPWKRLKFIGHVAL
jgi:hypothetical protein